MIYSRSSPTLRHPCTVACWILLLGVAVSGCNSSDYDLAPVEGTVLFEGKPLTEGQLMFSPVATGGDMNSGKAGFGNLKGDGTFEISTYTDGDGAVVAKHRVTLINNPKTPAGKALGVNRVMIPEALVVESGRKNNFTIEITREILKTYSTRF